eukprot:7132973-Prymnesium_polylepis.1
MQHTIHFFINRLTYGHAPINQLTYGHAQTCPAARVCSISELLNRPPRCWGRPRRRPGVRPACHQASPPACRPCRRRRPASTWPA